MRCPSGYLALNGAECSCQAGHCTVEADLRLAVRKTRAQTCDARMGALVPVLMEVANAQRVSPGVPARSMLTSAKEIHVESRRVR